MHYVYAVGEYKHSASGLAELTGYRYNMYDKMVEKKYNRRIAREEWGDWHRATKFQIYYWTENILKDTLTLASNALPF